MKTFLLVPSRMGDTIHDRSVWWLPLYFFAILSVPCIAPPHSLMLFRCMKKKLYFWYMNHFTMHNWACYRSISPTPRFPQLQTLYSVATLPPRSSSTPSFVNPFFIYVYLHSPRTSTVVRVICAGSARLYFFRHQIRCIFPAYYPCLAWKEAYVG